jgi:hypothetical protein
MTTTTPLESNSRSRRALLAGALGGIGAWAASAIGQASRVQAGVDGDVVLGTSNTATSRTSIHNFANNAAVFLAESAADLGYGGGIGVMGTSSSGTGVWGNSPAGHGLHGQSSSGYAGYFAGKVYTTRFYELTEINPPAAPGVNKARLFLKDNGSGKTQLCVRFHTGAVKVLATQP